MRSSFSSAPPILPAKIIHEAIDPLLFLLRYIKQPFHPRRGAQRVASSQSKRQPGKSKSTYRNNALHRVQPRRRSPKFNLGSNRLDRASSKQLHPTSKLNPSTPTRIPAAARVLGLTVLSIPTVLNTGLLPFSPYSVDVEHTEVLSTTSEESTMSPPTHHQHQTPIGGHNTPRNTACQACHARKKRCITSPPHYRCAHCRQQGRKCVPRASARYVYVYRRH